MLLGITASILVITSIAARPSSGSSLSATIRAPSTITYPNYYGAFLLDPDGINIEAFCNAPE